MSGRVKQERSPLGVVFSGRLGDRLTWHAAQRAIYLLRFLFVVDAIARRLAALGGPVIAPIAMLREKASFQVDTGLRSQNTEYEKFTDNDPNVVNFPSTSFTSTDAAHFCNLGFDPTTWAAVNRAAAHYRDAALTALIELAERMAGDTVQLPQRVNIGPDRIIDQLHWALAQAFLGHGPVVSPANAVAYGEAATEVINRYLLQNKLAGKFGVEACCIEYLKAYAGSVLEEVYESVKNNVWAECQALGLDRADYIV